MCDRTVDNVANVDRYIILEALKLDLWYVTICSLMTKLMTL